MIFIGMFSVYCLTGNAPYRTGFFISLKWTSVQLPHILLNLFYFIRLVFCLVSSLWEYGIMFYWTGVYLDCCFVGMFLQILYQYFIAYLNNTFTVPFIFQDINKPYFKIINIFLLTTKKYFAKCFNTSSKFCLMKLYVAQIYLQNCFSIMIKIYFSTHCFQKYIPALLREMHKSKFNCQLWLKVFFLVRNNIIRSSLAKSNLVVNFLTSVIKICRTTCKNFSKIANFNFYITQTSLHINRTWVIALKYYYKSSFPSLIWHNLPQFVYMFSTFSCFIFYTQISYFILVFRTHISFSYFTFFSFIYILLDMMHIYECIQKNSTFD